MSSPTLTEAGATRASASTDSTTFHGADETASTLVHTKGKSSIRRWFNSVRKAVFSSGSQKQSKSSSSGKEPLVHQIFTSPASSGVSVVVAPCGASEEDLADDEPAIKVEPTVVLKHVARNQQTSSVPASIVASVSAPASAPVETWCMAAFEQAELNDDEPTPAKPAKAKPSCKPRGPTMITPALLKKLAKDNKKYQGATAVRETEIKKSYMGAASSTSRARGVQASPMRWSQD